MLETLKFDSYFSSQLHYGFHIHETKIVEILNELQSRKVFVATDQGLLDSGLVKKVTAILDANNVEYAVFSQVEANPSSETVMKGKSEFLHHGCTSILAIGGGSVIDFAKCVGAIVNNEGDILDYRRGKKELNKQSVPLIIIPTTAGTGAEVTASAVISDKEANRKYIVYSQFIVPKYIILDPLFTLSLPSHIVAATGMDALVHAIESYVSNAANPISEAFSLQAIRLLNNSLEKSFASSKNVEARAEVYLASVLAGFAFNNGKLGIVHSCSHPLSAHFNVPHGLANAILLPYIIEFNLLANTKKFAEIARIFDPTLYLKSDREASRKLITISKELNENLTIPSSFNYLEIDVTEEKLNQLVADAIDDKGTYPFNPRHATQQDIKKIYVRAFEIEG